MVPLRLLHNYVAIICISVHTADDDFTTKSGTFTFSNTDMTQCTSISIVDDSVSESSDECFTVELSDGTETIDNPRVTTVCITDDDG